MAARLVYKVRKLRNKTNKNFIIGTLAGSVLAALTAILMTPKSGKKLISDLSKSLNLNQFEKVKKTTRPSRRKREDQAMIRHAVAAKQVVRKKVDKGIKTVKSKVNKHIHHHN